MNLESRDVVSLGRDEGQMIVCTARTKAVDNRLYLHDVMYRLKKKTAKNRYRLVTLGFPR